MSKTKKKLGTPPQESSQNLVHEETNSSTSLLLRKDSLLIDGRSLRRSPRKRQFTMKVTDELYELIYSLAREEKLMLTEVVEKTILEYAERKQRSKKNKKPK